MEQITPTTIHPKLSPPESTLQMIKCNLELHLSLQLILLHLLSGIRLVVLLKFIQFGLEFTIAQRIK